MNTVAKDIQISPVNMENRKEIDIHPGDTVRVWVKVEEKGKTRLQPFEGIVLARKHGSEPGATFTVRRVIGGYGVEKIFPLYSPAIDKIEIVRRAKMRRAKLYHIRKKVAREIKRQMRNMKMVELATTSDLEEKAQAQKSEEEEVSESKREEKEADAQDSKEDSKKEKEDNTEKGEDAEKPKQEEKKEHDRQDETKDKNESSEEKPPEEKKEEE